MEFYHLDQENECAPISRRQQINSIANRITVKLDCVPPALSNTYICKVHQQLRIVNEKAYEPVLLSIGPYHHSKRENSLQYMEEYKLRYFNKLTERMEIEKGIPKAEQLNNCLSALEGLEREARTYYADPITLSSCDFLEMMLLDGCFIIELFYRGAWSNYQDAEEIDPLLKIGWIRHTLSTDLILIENQLPFFVLEKLWCTIGFAPDSFLLKFTALLFSPIYYNFPREQRLRECKIELKRISILFTDNLFMDLGMARYSKFKVLNIEKFRDTRHLLDLVYKLMLIADTPEVKQETNHGDKREDTIGTFRYILDLVHKIMSNRKTGGTNHGAQREDTVGLVKYLLYLVRKGMLNRETPEVKQEDIDGIGPAAYIPTKCAYSATKLSDLGVRFEPIEEGKFYGIKFKEWVLKIPIIQIHDKTEVIFRNLVAYEEHVHSNNVKYIIEYISFMDGLIDSPKDVELLRHKGIIDNMMGDDAVVSAMFNRMLDNVIISSGFYHGKTVRELTKYCKKKRHKWMASLKRNYLSSPWRILSIIAAFILLTVALLQTVYTTLSYYYN